MVTCLYLFYTYEETLPPKKKTKKNLMNGRYGIKNRFHGLLRKAMCNIVGHVVGPYGTTQTYNIIGRDSDDFWRDRFELHRSRVGLFGPRPRAHETR